MIWNENPPVIVLLARQFNPSVITQIWLSRQGVLDADGTFNAGTIFADNLVQVITNDFVFSMTPDQLQFMPNVEPERQQALICEKVGAIVKSLPHVPYRAVGLNFNWHMTPGESFEDVSRSLFAGRADGVYSRFTEKNARFGTYLSKDFGLFRMKVDIKPVIFSPPEKQPEDRIQFGFNFHSDLPPTDDVPEAVKERFSNWNVVREEAVQTIRAAGYKE